MMNSQYMEALLDKYVGTLEESEMEQLASLYHQDGHYREAADVLLEIVKKRSDCEWNKPPEQAH